ncbi:MAG: DUF1849 family protein [Pseudomonadota bacterium]
MKHHNQLVAGASILAVLAISPAGFAAPTEVLSGFVSHTAVYNVTLDGKADRADGIEGATGKLVYELEGDACEGFATRFRFVLNFAAGDTNVLTDQQTTTFEAADGSSFNFATKVFTNRNLDRQIIGSASLADEDLTVNLRQPETEEVELSSAVFPNQHLASIVSAAKRGETFVRAQVFDGADNGTETFFTQTVIGRPRTGLADDSAETGILPSSIASQKWWPVSVSYFKETASGRESGGENEPFYSVSFKLYENGFSRDLRMDYTDFALKATLTELNAADGPAKC